MSDTDMQIDVELYACFTARDPNGNEEIITGTFWAVDSLDKIVRVFSGRERLADAFHRKPQMEGGYYSACWPWFEMYMQQEYSKYGLDDRRSAWAETRFSEARKIDMMGNRLGVCWHHVLGRVIDEPSIDTDRLPYNYEYEYQSVTEIPVVRANCSVRPVTVSGHANWQTYLFQTREATKEPDEFLAGMRELLKPVSGLVLK